MTSGPTLVNSVFSLGMPKLPAGLYGIQVDPSTVAAAPPRPNITSVALEVYSATRPAVPMRAWFSSLFLLVLASGLAGWMSWTRSGEALATRFAPPGWDISFRPPMRFELLPLAKVPSAHAVVFQAPTPSGGSAELVFRRFEPRPDLDADEVCNQVLRPHSSIWLAVFGSPPTRTIEKLGDLDAVQIHYPDLSLVVRAVVRPGGPGYAVSLRLENDPLEEPMYRAFDLTCRSVEFKPHP